MTDTPKELYLTPQKLRDMILERAKLEGDRVSDFDRFFFDFADTKPKKKNENNNDVVHFSDGELKRFSDFAKCLMGGSCDVTQAAVDAGLIAPPEAHNPAYNPDNVRYTDAKAIGMIMEKVPEATKDEVRQKLVTTTRTAPDTVSQRNIENIARGLERDHAKRLKMDMDQASRYIISKQPGIDLGTARDKLSSMVQDGKVSKLDVMNVIDELTVDPEDAISPSPQPSVVPVEIVTEPVQSLDDVVADKPILMSRAESFAADPGTFSPKPAEPAEPVQVSQGGRMVEFHEAVAYLMQTYVHKEGVKRTVMKKDRQKNTAKDKMGKFDPRRMWAPDYIETETPKEVTEQKWIGMTKDEAKKVIQKKIFAGKSVEGASVDLDALTDSLTELKVVDVSKEGEELINDIYRAAGLTKTFNDERIKKYVHTLVRRIKPKYQTSLEVISTIVAFAEDARTQGVVLMEPLALRDKLYTQGEVPEKKEDTSSEDSVPSSEEDIGPAVEMTEHGVPKSAMESSVELPTEEELNETPIAHLEDMPEKIIENVTRRHEVAESVSTQPGPVADDALAPVEPAQPEPVQSQSPPVVFAGLTPELKAEQDAKIAAVQAEAQSLDDALAPVVPAQPDDSSESSVASSETVPAMSVKEAENDFAFGSVKSAKPADSSETPVASSEPETVDSNATPVMGIEEQTQAQAEFLLRKEKARNAAAIEARKNYTPVGPPVIAKDMVYPDVKGTPKKSLLSKIGGLFSRKDKGQETPVPVIEPAKYDIPDHCVENANDLLIRIAGFQGRDESVTDLVRENIVKYAVAPSIEVVKDDKGGLHVVLDANATNRIVTKRNMDDKLPGESAKVKTLDNAVGQWVEEFKVEDRTAFAKIAEDYISLVAPIFKEAEDSHKLAGINPKGVKFVDTSLGEIIHNAYLSVIPKITRKADDTESKSYTPIAISEIKVRCYREFARDDVESGKEKSRIDAIVAKVLEDVEHMSYTPGSIHVREDKVGETWDQIMAGVKTAYFRGETPDVKSETKVTISMDAVEAPGEMILLSDAVSLVNHDYSTWSGEIPASEVFAELRKRGYVVRKDDKEIVCVRDIKKVARNNSHWVDKEKEAVRLEQREKDLLNQIESTNELLRHYIGDSGENPFIFDQIGILVKQAKSHYTVLDINSRGMDSTNPVNIKRVELNKNYQARLAEIEAEGLPVMETIFAYLGRHTDEAILVGEESFRLIGAHEAAKVAAEHALEEQTEKLYDTQKTLGGTLRKLAKTSANLEQIAREKADFMTKYEAQKEEAEKAEKRYKSARRQRNGLIAAGIAALVIYGASQLVPIVSNAYNGWRGEVAAEKQAMNHINNTDKRMQLKYDDASSKFKDMAAEIRAKTKAYKNK